MELALYPFTIIKKYAAALLIPLIPIIFLVFASVYGGGGTEFQDIKEVVDYHFGSNVSFAASDLTQYDQIGANGLIPIIRLGGITKGLDAQDVGIAYSALAQGVISAELVSFLIIFITIFLGYIAFAMVSRIVFATKNNLPTRLGLEGINLQTILLSFSISAIVVFISLFSMEGFELVMLLNFGVFFALAIPSAVTGDKFGESLFDAFDFVKFNFGKLIVIYILSIGVAIAAQIGLLIVFMFPLSVIDPNLVPIMKVMLSFVAVMFALFYQFVVCSRSVYDFTRKAQVKVPALRKIARKVK